MSTRPSGSGMECMVKPGGYVSMQGLVIPGLNHGSTVKPERLGNTQIHQGVG